MLGAVGSPGNLERPFVQGVNRLQPALFAQHQGQIVETHGQARMVGTETVFLDGNDPLIGVFSPAIILNLIQQGGQVAQAGGHRRVRRTVHRCIDLAGPDKQGPGVGELSGLV